MFREAVMSFLGVGNDESPIEKVEKTVGWYCRGECVAECSKMFGPALEKVCSTCPT